MVPNLQSAKKMSNTSTVYQHICVKRKYKNGDSINLLLQMLSELFVHRISCGTIKIIKKTLSVCLYVYLSILFLFSPPKNGREYKKFKASVQPGTGGRPVAGIKYLYCIILTTSVKKHLSSGTPFSNYSKSSFALHCLIIIIILQMMTK